MDELTELAEKGLLRRLRCSDRPSPPFLEIEGREVINFSSNDYLGFSQHPALIEAASRALTNYGIFPTCLWITLTLSRTRRRNRGCKKNRSRPHFCQWLCHRYGNHPFHRRKR